MRTKEIVKLIESSNFGFICGRLEEKPKFKGGCGQPVKFMESYRCADCTASFHRDCIHEHFKSPLAIQDIKDLK